MKFAINKKNKNEIVKVVFLENVQGEKIVKVFEDGMEVYSTLPEKTFHTQYEIVEE